MQKYISILRGINVGGKNIIKMDDLKEFYKFAGLTDVKTYIQSGNVLFNSNSNDISKTMSKVENSIMDKLGYKVKILIRTKENIGKIIKMNPFLKLSNVNAKKLYITFLESEPQKEFINHLIPEKETDDIFEVIDSEVFIYCHEGYGKTVFSNNYIEKKLKLKATTRNWRTINKLFQLASE